MTRFDQRMRLLGLCLLAVAMSISASAQTYKELVSFNGNTAAGPVTPLTQGIDGALYGTTIYGGTGTCNGNGIGCGIVFKITRNGGFKILYNFQSGGPVHPTNDLVLGDDGNLYGTAAGGYGTIFKITPGGSFTTLYSFTGGPAGYQPEGGIIQGTDGNFYGTTLNGGAPSNSCPSGCGTIYKLTPAGVLTTLYSFCPQNYCPDGQNPEGTLAEGLDGNFYGTAVGGGLYKEGTVFRISPSGDFKLLYTFEGTPPYGGGLTLANDGNFYGALNESLYRITPQGVYTGLSQLDSAGVSLPIQGTDGHLYVPGETGGKYDVGNLFEMPLDGVPVTLYSFVGFPTDGSYPVASLVQATNGTFYGTTYTGGSSPCNYSLPGCGTVFSLDMGLNPFVVFVRSARSVGQRFGLLGQGFTGTTSVSLNGTSASFTIKSDTLIVATIPAGATTGYVTVTTPSGTLTSNVQFHVIP